LSQPIALTRAQDDAEATAAALAGLGYPAVVAPAIEIVALTTRLPEGRFDALIATSPRAVRALGQRERHSLAATPLYVVGGRAAEAAAASGLSLASPPAEDAATLAAQLRSTLKPVARLLYLAGRDRKPILEAALAQAGHEVAAVELYAAQARAGWSAREARAVAGCAAALHYSRRTAALTLILAERAGLAAPFRAMVHVCLSADVAAPLIAAGAARVVVADRPDETRLLAALEGALGSRSKD